MNHFSRFPRHRDPGCPARPVLFMVALLLAACGGPVSESAERGDPNTYRVHYLASLQPDKQQVVIRLAVSQSRSLLREMRFSSENVTEVSGDGDIEFVDGDIVWNPPVMGGELRWQTVLASKRGGQTYDAWLNDDWGVFRAEDIIPRASTRTLKSAVADTSLAFKLPAKWSVVTEYAEVDGKFPISKSDRRFAQPSGWVVAGLLGVRRDIIAGTRVAIAAPEDQGVRRMDMLALLNWTMPELARIVPEMPDRITVVSAAEPMWRGGLSGPQSIYIHAGRPLISENGTSTLLHELMHVSLHLRAAPGYDWIIEGIAEYYSLQLLQRSSTLSAKRFASSLRQQVNWSKKATVLCAPSSTGAGTALAVVTIHAIDNEVRTATANESSFDDVLLRLLNQKGPIDGAMLRSIVSGIAGQKSDVLHADRLPGCSKLAAGKQDT